MCRKRITTWAVHIDVGRGVEVDKKKAKYYYELAAMNGDVQARYNLGCRGTGWQSSTSI